MNVSKVVSRSKSALHLLQIELVGLQMFIELNFLGSLTHYLSNFKGLMMCLEIEFLIEINT